MYLFLLVFFVVAFCTYAVHISLLPKGWKYGVALFFPSLFTLGIYGFSAKQSSANLDWLIAQSNLISAIAIIQTFEALLFIALTIVQIKSFFGIKWPKVWPYLSLFPSLQLILGLILLQTYLFLQIDGWSFFYLAILFFTVCILLLTIVSFGIKKLIKTWADRAEVKILLLLFQLLLAMFLPLMAAGLKVNFTQITLDLFSIAICTTVVIVGTTWGYLRYKHKN